MAQALKALSPVTITTAGSPVALTASTALFASTVVVAADSLNTGKVYIGDSSVSAANGVELAPGQSMTIECSEIRGSSEGLILSDIYADTATNGNKVRIAYLARK